MAETKNPALVLDVMGHADLHTTMIYQHPDLEPLRDAINHRNQRLMWLRSNTVTTQSTTHTNVMAGRAAAKCMTGRNLLEPTIGLEPMTCRLRIGRWNSRKLKENKGHNNKNAASVEGCTTHCFVGVSGRRWWLLGQLWAKSGITPSSVGCCFQTLYQALGLSLGCDTSSFQLLRSERSHSPADFGRKILNLQTRVRFPVALRASIR